VRRRWAARGGVLSLGVKVRVFFFSAVEPCVLAFFLWRTAAIAALSSFPV